jgi:RHS repeat-associated protein
MELASALAHQRCFAALSAGLVKFGTRYYNPNLGRWTQRDAKASNQTGRQVGFMEWMEKIFFPLRML